MIKKILLILLVSMLGLAGMFFMLIRLGHKDVRRTVFSLPPASFSDWEDVLHNPAGITVSAHQTGIIRINKGSLINLKHPAAKDIADEMIDAPVFAYIIRHEKYGDFLVDTGLDRSYATSRHGNLTGIFVNAFVPEADLRNDECISDTVKRMNISLEGVFLTHLHFDHIAGAADLDSSLLYVCSRSEPYENYRFLYFSDSLKNVLLMHEIDFGKIRSMAPFGPAADIFGDGSFWAIEARGHTKAFTAYLVNSTGNPILILGDSCCLKTGFEKGIGPGLYSTDIKAAQEFLDKAEAFVSTYPQTVVYFGHDRETVKR